MARIDYIEHRLLNWARWKEGGTSGGLGFSAMKYGEQAMTADYQARYRESSIPVDACEAEETDRAVAALDSTHKRTVEVVYLLQLSARGAAAKLCVSAPTVDQRLWAAHRSISRWLDDRRLAREAERARTEALQRAAA
jgi:hypothetical protein